MYWNSKATGALLLTSTDVDKTGNSYYGKQTLHFLNQKESALVVLGRFNSIELPFRHFFLFSLFRIDPNVCFSFSFCR